MKIIYKYVLYLAVCLGVSNVNAQCNAPNGNVLSFEYSAAPEPGSENCGIKLNEYGYDTMDTADSNDDHVSVAKGVSTYVRVKVQSGSQFIDFTSDQWISAGLNFDHNDNIIKLEDNNVSFSATDGFMLKITGAAVGTDTITVTSSSGQVCGQIYVNVYKKNEIDTLKFHPESGVSSERIAELSSGCFALANRLAKPAVMEFKNLVVGSSVDFGDYDKNSNGSLDNYYLLEVDDDDDEVAVVEAVCGSLDGDAKVIVLNHPTKLAFPILHDSSVGVLSVEVDDYSAVYLDNYSGYKREVEFGAEGTIYIDEIIDFADPDTEEVHKLVTFCTKQDLPYGGWTPESYTLQYAHTQMDKDHCIFTEGAFAIGSRQYAVVKNGASNSLVVHEIFHTTACGSLYDVAKEGNIMNNIPSSGGLRFKPFSITSQGQTGTQSQWESVLRPNP